MAEAFRLQTLLEVSEQRLESSGRELQRLRNLVNEAQAKLDQLAGFRNEYGAMLEARLTQGLSAHQLRDYQLFLSKLDRAKDAQAGEVERRQIAWRQEHARWIELRQREQALHVLSDRHQQAELNKEARRDQKQQDEFALRGARKPPST